jgi:peptidoglycan DL-endopeptidase LytF
VALPALSPPTPSAPLRVLEIGDSLGIDLGDRLEADLANSGLATTTMASQGDSGLANTGFYDWPAQLSALLATDHPQIVVVLLGANDDQGLVVDGQAVQPGTQAWAAAYAQRVDEIAQESIRAGARVAWVAVPPMQDVALNAFVNVVNAIDEREVDALPGTLFLASSSVLGGPAGAYENALPDASGASVVVRTPDGVHLTTPGAERLSSAVIAAMDRRWSLGIPA